MGAKDIVLKVIKSSVANDFVKQNHYSGKVVPNSQLHFGVFLGGILGGVMSYGPSTDKSKMIGLIEGTGRNEFIELNRMAFSPILPKNSESRAIAISLKLMKKHAPQIKRVVSFADGCQCGDGTIYRAAGFELTQIKENKSILLMPDGKIMSDKTLNNASKQKYKEGNAGYWKRNGAESIDGFMLRYIKHLQPNLKRNYEVLQYSKIQEMGAGMYRGEKKEKHIEM